MTNINIYGFVLIHFLNYGLQVSGICSELPNCSCPETKNKQHIKLRCVRIQTVKELVTDKFVAVSPSIHHLDLSNNTIREIPANSFPLPTLMKLNLEKNNIEVISDKAFSGMVNLKKLVLSNNKLRELRKNMFEGLHSVDNLKINQNFISSIPNDTFDFLLSLKQLDISGNPLICDCDLWWLLTTRFKLVPMPKCDSPISLRGQPIDRTHLQSECNPVYLFSIIPDEDQIAFEGDSLKMICVIRGFGRPATADQLISWTWEGRNPTIVFNNTSQYQDINTDSDVVESTLIINDLYDKHSGEWRCNSLLPKLNRSLSVHVSVLSRESIYCEVTFSENDKGRYTWPETITGHVIELPCEVTSMSKSDTNSIETATYSCANNGSWLDLNTDNCPYISPVTRILQGFSKMNLTNHKASLIESATGLRNYTINNLFNITSTKDFHFIVATVENFITFLENEPDLGIYLLEIISSVLKLPKNLMEKAQEQHLVCSRVIGAIEAIVKYCPSLEFSQDHFALTEISLSSDAFIGITCSWIRSVNDLSLNCSAVNRTLPKGLVVEASIQIMMSLLYQLETKMTRLIITVFDDGRIFPVQNDDKESSLVIGINIVGVKKVKLDEPIIITIKNNGHPSASLLTWWDEETGTWTKTGCQLSSSMYSPYLKFSCDRLGYFSLLTEHYEDPFLTKQNIQEKLFSHFLHASVYIGTFISVTCLLLASATYCFCYVHIQMSKKMKHSLMNTWLSASLLFLVFSVGIYQTDHEILCQVIGLAIHYFALATLFWMTITIKALYKRVQKSNRSVSTPSEDIPADIPIEKPILGIYLVGWGISAIICGIAGAINVRGYSGNDYCFLSPGPELCTVFIPASVVMFYLLIMCLLVKCAAGNNDSNPQLSVGTQAIDLELLDGCGANGMAGGRSSYTQEGCNSVRSITTPSSQAEDIEHSPGRQLKAFIIFWVLYMVSVLSAAGCVMLPLQLPLYEEKMFSFTYASMCLLLGAFVLFFHCFARNDVRSAWSRLLRGKNLSHKSPHIIANAFMPTGPTTQTLTSIRMNGPANGGSEVQGNILSVKNSTTLDDHSTRSEFLKQTPNINLVRLHRQHYRGCSTLMVGGNFYNPQQSIVAKKFFKKQRKKRNNSLQIRKCRSGGSSPVSSALLFDGDMARMKMNPSMKRNNEINICDNGENVQFLHRPNANNDCYDELSSEKHPLTYDEPDITGCEEGKTGTGSEATFTVPEYAEIQEQTSTKYDNLIPINEKPIPPRIRTKESMCGTSDHDWCSCDAISDVNSEPTYNYAYIRNSYESSRSVISDESSANSHLYTSVVADVSNSVDRYRGRPRPRARPPRSRQIKNRPSRVNYRARGNYRDNYSNEFNVKGHAENDLRKRRKEEGYVQLMKDKYYGLSPSDFSSEDKVETCV